MGAVYLLKAAYMYLYSCMYVAAEQMLVKHMAPQNNNNYYDDEGARFVLE